MGNSEFFNKLRGGDLPNKKKIARLTTVAKGKNFLTRIWKSNRVGIR